MATRLVCEMPSPRGSGRRNDTTAGHTNSRMARTRLEPEEGSSGARARRAPHRRTRFGGMCQAVRTARAARLADRLRPVGRHVNNSERPSAVQPGPRWRDRWYGGLQTAQRRNALAAGFPIPTSRLGDSTNEPGRTRAEAVTPRSANKIPWKLQNAQQNRVLPARRTRLTSSRARTRLRGRGEPPWPHRLLRLLQRGVGCRTKQTDLPRHVGKAEQATPPPIARTLSQ
jgi:hypothetical protein